MSLSTETVCVSVCVHMCIRGGGHPKEPLAPWVGQFWPRHLWPVPRLRLAWMRK